MLNKIRVFQAALLLGTMLTLSGCAVVSVTTAVVGVGVTVASTAVGAGVAVGSAAVKAAIPGD